MYLSKVSFPSSAQGAKALMKINSNGAYASHQLLWQLFTEEKQRTFLFRENTTKNGTSEFYVLSTSLPSAGESPLSIVTKTFMPKLIQGQRLAYKLKVNPTVCTKALNGKNKRHDVLMHAKYQARKKKLTGHQDKELMDQAAYKWISDGGRLQSWGFSLDGLPEISQYTQHKSKKVNGNNILFSSVDFQGVLIVQDVNKFLAQYAKGFGRAKSLGCGLMMIRPI